jgi:nucleotide-binding universal stress UspA family protein
MKVLLPIDGSADALHAVKVALQWVRQGLRAEFVLVNVQDPATIYEMVVAHDVERIALLRAEAGAELLEPAEALLQAAGQPYESEVAGGSPAALLPELAENYRCEAVLMGARGVGTPGASGIGSVAESMLQYASMPVTIVRCPNEEPPSSDEPGDDDSA